MLEYLDTKNHIKLAWSSFVNVEVAKINARHLQTRNCKCVFVVLETGQRFCVGSGFQRVEQTASATSNVCYPLLLIVNSARRQQIDQPFVESGIEIGLDRFFI